MVATRRGVRVSSPNRVNDESFGNVEATPATRRGRRKAVREEPQTQSEVTSDSQHDEGEEGVVSASPAGKSSTVKRKPRGSKPQTRGEAQPDSTHEADVSESESCCSAASDLQAAHDVRVTRSGRRHTSVQQKPAPRREEDVPSEAESACSSASARRGSNTRRTTRSQQRSVPAEDQPPKRQNADNEHSEAESCASVVSGGRAAGTKRLTRSQKRNALSRASSKSRTEDTEISEADSCSSSVSGLRGSTVRRTTRGRRGRVVEPIPIHIEESEDTSPLPSKQTRARRTTQKAASEPQSHDSEGFESGPSMTPRRATRSRPAVSLVLSDSDSEMTDVYSPLGSPSSLRGKGTPCSSRTGSGSSVRALSLSQATAKALNVLEEQEASVSPSHLGPPPSDEQKVSPLDVTCQSAKVIVTEPAEAEENKVIEHKDAHLSPQCSLIEEVSEEEKTLIAEESGVTSNVTVEEDAEPQIIQEASPSPSKTVTVTLCPSTVVEEEDKAMDVDLSLDQDASTEESQETMTLANKEDTSVPLKVEENIEQDKELHGAEEEEVCPSETIKVTVSDAAGTEEKVVEEEITMDVDSTVATECQKSEGGSEKDETVAVEVESASPSVPENTEQHKRPYERRPDGCSLLESSDEEGETSDGGHSEEEDGDELNGEGSDSEDEIIRTDENQAGPSKPKAKSWSAVNDGLFVIDTKPGFQSDQKYYIDGEQKSEDKEMDREECSDKKEEEDEDFVDEEGDEDDDSAEDAILFKSRKPALISLSSSIDPGLKVKDVGGLYIDVDGSKSKTVSNALKKLRDQKNQDELLKKSVIGPDFEKKDSVPPYKESKQAMKLKRKEEREKTTGDGWFNMKAPELTEELKNDLKVLKMRAAMDPKRFYKKNDRDGFPKYFQVGTVVDSPVDFYHSRIPKKQRKRTMVEELLADAEFRSQNKKKYKQIMTEKAALAAGRKNRKKNKFRKKQAA
ncbi:hypothetical protein MATL_G00027140 [Megalops atlanticus]|uniref:Fcf2 pre-rRNA processing C-terminal domain-containing protein n=1 Tax=Megalops atlanticus TaxID=7932 RepID=A0A9D3QC45_MEGAT|nr:hypothetical protein MATL_G00027140 [Megalops atlanticus]